MNYFKEMTQAQMDVLFHILNQSGLSSDALNAWLEDKMLPNSPENREKFYELRANLLGMAINSSPEE